MSLKSYSSSPHDKQFHTVTNLLSVCLEVTSITCEKNGWTDWDAICVWTCRGQGTMYWVGAQVRPQNGVLLGVTFGHSQICLWSIFSVLFTRSHELATSLPLQLVINTNHWNWKSNAHKVNHMTEQATVRHIISMLVVQMQSTVLVPLCPRDTDRMCSELCHAVLAV